MTYPFNDDLLTQMRLAQLEEFTRVLPSESALAALSVYGTHSSATAALERSLRENLLMETQLQSIRVAISGSRYQSLSAAQLALQAMRVGNSIEILAASSRVEELYSNPLHAQIERLREERSRMFRAFGFEHSAAVYATSLASWRAQPAELSAFVDSYITERERLARYSLDTFGKLSTRDLIVYENAGADEVENLDVNGSEVADDSREALIRVDRLPFAILAEVMRSPETLQELSPRQFEEFVASILEKLKFQDIVLTPRSADGGKDVVARKIVNGIPLSIYFECKKYSRGHKVQLETVRALLGTISHDCHQVNKGVLVTTSRFTKGCTDFILSDARLDGKDYDGILGWIDEAKRS